MIVAQELTDDAVSLLQQSRSDLERLQGENSSLKIQVADMSEKLAEIEQREHAEQEVLRKKLAEVITKVDLHLQAATKV